MGVSTPPAMMDVRELAAYCSVSAKTVYRAIESGKLRCARLGDGGAYRIRREWADAWIDDSAAPPTRPYTAPMERRVRGRGSLRVPAGDPR